MNFPIVFRFTDAKTQDLLLAVSKKLGKSPIEAIPVSYTHLTLPTIA